MPEQLRTERRRYGDTCVSEYQYAEFLAADRPLTPEQIAELRALPVSAEISDTGFHTGKRFASRRSNQPRNSA